jgi:hypothetical protein
MTGRTASVRLNADQARQLEDAARHLGQTQSDILRRQLDAWTLVTNTAVDQAQQVRRAAEYAEDPTPYRFDGSGEHSFIRDIKLRYSDSDAAARLDRFSQWQAEVAARFTTGSAGNLSEVVPPMYQRLVVVPEQDRPLRAAATVVQLPARESATPFTLPGVVTTTDGAQTPGEGVDADDSGLGFAGGTVTPTGVVGRFPLSRELVDAASPAADMVALMAAREDFARQAEARVFAELNGANGQGGTIGGGGFVPSGARVRTAADAAALHAALKAAVADYAFHAGRKPRSVACSADAAEALSGVLDESSGDDAAMWRVGGTPVNPAPAMVDVSATDGDVLVLAPGQLWVWESPLLEFRYAEKLGPAAVELVLFGYMATRLVRPVGLSAIRYTG